MAKSKVKPKAKKDSITLEKNAFIVLLLFVVAATMLAVYAYMGFAVVR